jgi:hypothetical protein
MIAKNRLFKTALTALILLLLISCTKAIRLSSYDDGPYVFYADEKAGVITFDRSLDPDTTYFNLQKSSEAVTSNIGVRFDSMPAA